MDAEQDPRTADLSEEFRLTDRVQPPASIKTYSLEEVAAMVLPTDMAQPVLWLQRSIRSGKASGYKVGNKWRMTHDDVLDLISRNRPPPPPSEEEPEHYPGGLTRRSWLNLQRGRARTPVARVERPDITYPMTHPVDESWKWVRPAPPEVIASMPDLSRTQLDLLNRVQSEGELQYSGRAARRTVEALARRGLVTYDAEYVCEEGQSYYFVRFTVRAITT